LGKQPVSLGNASTVNVGDDLVATLLGSMESVAKLISCKEQPIYQLFIETPTADVIIQAIDHGSITSP
jgi:hypothetical protein